MPSCVSICSMRRPGFACTNDANPFDGASRSAVAARRLAYTRVLEVSVEAGGATRPGHRLATSTTRGFDHDIFIIHADADEPFVRGYLVPESGLTPERIVVLGELDLGGVKIEEI